MSDREIKNRKEKRKNFEEATERAMPTRENTTVSILLRNFTAIVEESPRGTRVPWGYSRKRSLVGGESTLIIVLM
ncbi:hypothetical protein COF37_21400 [Bacillus wiedmannii]|nr:hypothetical protein COF37_21400 [Bacillus wiedmannii]